MSVTFTPNLPSKPCEACAGAGFTGDYNLGTDVDCAACGMTGRAPESAPTLNLANTNAAALLAALGYDAADLVGEADASDLLGRALLRAALPASEPVPTVTDGNVTTFGRPEGYFQVASAGLAAVAEYAHDHGVTVIWS